MKKAQKIALIMTIIMFSLAGMIAYLPLMDQGGDTIASGVGNYEFTPDHNGKLIVWDQHKFTSFEDDGYTINILLTQEGVTLITWSFRLASDSSYQETKSVYASLYDLKKGNTYSLEISGGFHGGVVFLDNIFQGPAYDLGGKADYLLWGMGLFIVGLISSMGIRARNRGYDYTGDYGY